MTNKNPAPSAVYPSGDERVQDVSPAASVVKERGDQLQDLLRRVESATGADRELDADLLRAAGWRDDGEHMGAPRWITPEGMKTAFNPREGVPTGQNVTGSLDAALALVERCGQDAQQIINEATGDTYLWVDAVPDYRQRLVLATLAALLKALDGSSPPLNTKEEGR